MGILLKLSWVKIKEKSVQSRLFLIKKNNLVIGGINKKIKHVKPPRKEEAGKIITFNAPLDYSNVMICDENGKTTRVSFDFQDNRKVRISTKTKNLIS